MFYSLLFNSQTFNNFAVENATTSYVCVYAIFTEIALNEKKYILQKNNNWTRGRQSSFYW